MADSTKHAVMGALSKKGSGKKPHTHSIHIRRADGGGFIARHEMKTAAGDPAPDQEHVLPDADSMGDHVQAAMGDQPPAQMPPGAGAPAAAPGGGPGGDSGAMG